MTRLVLYLILTSYYVLRCTADLCYSCSGICYTDDCNCQMGSCSAKQCFIEKKPTDIPGVMKITKGCMKRSTRLHTGCQLDNFSDHVLCVCNGEFCNSQSMSNATIRNSLEKLKVECRRCGEKNPDCNEKCFGNWCHEDITTGAAGCGYGPPSLPFFYKGFEILYYNQKICVTLSRGAGKTHRYCICNSNMCNTQSLINFNLLKANGKYIGPSIRNLSPLERSLSLQLCHNCEITSQDVNAVSITSNCRSSRCHGHYCTYVAQRHFNKNGGRITTIRSLTEAQGCMNISDNRYVMTGCSHKWISEEYEEVRCACRGDLCNNDSYTASTNVFNLLFIVISIVLFTNHIIWVNIY